MKQIASTILLLSLSLHIALAQCNPDPTYLNDTLGFYGNTQCSASTFTFSSVTDMMGEIEFLPGNPTTFTYFFDAFRIESLQGVPAGLAINTDVMASADIDGPYGYWYNGGNVPNQSPIVGCLSFSGDANLIASLSTGGPNNDGIYPILVNLDVRIEGTQPDLSAVIQNGSWWSALPASLGGGYWTYELLLNVNGGSSITTSSLTSGASCVSGSADITVSGASLPLTYTLDNSNPITTQTNVISLAGLSVGAHNVSGIDNNGCGFSEDFQIDGIVPYQQEAICLVTVDSTTGENLVVWEKTLGVYTERFNIYKQNNVTSGYDSIGFVSVDSLSAFVDVGSNPQQGSDRYRISVVDECGVESTISASHRTIHVSANQGINGEVNLSWNAYEGFSFANFEIYRSNNGNPYLLINNVANNNFSYTDLTPPAGVNYYKIGVVNPSGCNPTRSVMRSFSNIINDDGSPVSIGEELRHAENLTVYPNPSNGMFTVNAKGAYALDVLDVSGRTVYNGNANGNTAIDLSHLQAGIYMLSITQNENRTVKRLLKR